VRDFLQFHRDTLLFKCAGLTGEQLLLKAVPTSQLTLLGLVRHLAECERWWIHGTLDGGPYEEWVVPVDGNDPSRGWKTVIDAPDHASLLRLLEEWHRPTERWLEKPVSELSRVVTSKSPGRPDRTMTVHWVLDNMQQHEIHHRAQLLLYFRLMGLTPPTSM